MNTATMPVAADATHPVHQLVFTETSHAYRLRSDCTMCAATGRVQGAREGVTKLCPKCKGAGERFSRLPSVTTVLGKLAKPGLVYWSANLAADTIARDLHERLRDCAESHEEWIGRYSVDDVHTWAERARTAHVDRKNEAADTGSAVHDAIEAFHTEFWTAEAPTDHEAAAAWHAFIAWWNRAGYECIESERMVCDPQARYCGRFDLLLRDKRGRVWVADVKTSNSLQPEHVLQCAAYAHCLRSEGVHRIAGTMVLWCRKDGSPVVALRRTAREARRDFRVFEALLGVYEHDKTLGPLLRAVNATPTR